MEATQAIEQLDEQIRQIEVQVTKAEKRLDSLELAGIDTSKWLQKAESIQRDKRKPSISTSTTELRTGEHACTCLMVAAENQSRAPNRLELQSDSHVGLVCKLHACVYIHT